MKNVWLNSTVMLPLFKYNCLGLLVFVLVGCQSTTSSEGDYSTKVDSTFNIRFELYGDGFTGGDGTYSVELPDGRSVWIFGDTFLGEVTPELTREKTSPMYIRNCFVIQDGDKITTLHQGKPEEFKSMMIPPEVTESDFEVSELDVWYWPGDGYVDDSGLNVFVSKFGKTGEGMWDFEFRGTALVKYELPGLVEKEIVEIPYSEEKDIHYGHAVCETDDFIYVYGLGEKSIHVARGKRMEDTWQFYNGEIWTSNPEETGSMLNIDGSEQFSIFQWDDKYVLITQLGGFSVEVHSFISDTPFGPWENETLIYETPIPYDSLELFTYNAVAHPQFTENDELLISYNTNSMVLADHFVNAGIYRPRFFRVSKALVFN